MQILTKMLKICDFQKNAFDAKEIRKHIQPKFTLVAVASSGGQKHYAAEKSKIIKSPKLKNTVDKSLLNWSSTNFGRVKFHSCL